MKMNREIKCLGEMQVIAKEVLSKENNLYFSAAAGSVEIPTYNEEAFNKYKILPRMLRDVSHVNTSTTVLRKEVAFPVGAAPIGLLGMARDDGEIETARACAAEECIMILSSVSTCTIEEVSRAAFENPSHHPNLWMQVYIFNDRSVTLDLVRRAEDCGFSAIVVTIDSPAQGLWKNRMPSNFAQTKGIRQANLPCAPYKLLDPSVTFEDLKWLKRNTRLPLIAKGIMTAEDAVLAAECEMSAIIISNHGGRQLEGVQSTIDVLEDVVDAVRGSHIDVYLDGGVRTGSDVFRALALGAKAVFIGRPVVWGLSIEGESGVRKVLQIMKDEVRRTMQLAGASKIHDIQKSMVCNVSKTVNSKIVNYCNCQVTVR